MTTDTQQPEAGAVAGTAHTPTPWYQHTDGDKTYASLRALSLGCIADCGSRSDQLAQANAAFIVRACNSHEALVRALRFAAESRTHNERLEAIDNAREVLASLR